MHCVLSLCMWSVFGLCAVKHRIGHQWGSRWVPSWQNLLRLQIMVCVHVSVNVCADMGWNMAGLTFFAADCFLVWFMELKEFKENVTSSSLCHGLTWSGKVVSAHFSFFDTIMTCFIMHGTGSAYEYSLRSWQSVAHEILSGFMSYYHVGRTGFSDLRAAHVHSSSESNKRSCCFLCCFGILCFTFNLL